MKTQNNSAWKNFGLLIFIVSCCFGILLTSCQKDEKDSEPAYFTIEGNPSGLSVTAGSKMQSYVVRSNRPWQIVAQDEGDWITALPDEGDDDGIFTFVVEKNNTFESRTMNFAIIVEGLEQIIFPVEQAANVPYVTIQDAEKGITILADGGEVNVNITSNTEWTYTLNPVNWISGISVDAGRIVLSATVNNGAARSVVLTVSATNYPGTSQSITLTQLPGSVLLDENFSWLAYGSAVFYTTTGETRYDAWTSEELGRGWGSTVNTTDGSGNTPLVYARQGFVKLGKTSYGGDLITPKLDFEGTQNLKVSFKAVPYMTAAGTQDDNVLNIILIGPGTLSDHVFTIANWPNYDTDPLCTAIWADPTAGRTFTITGATSETQIKFLGGDYYLKGVGKGKNRIFMDDIKIEIVD